jgi:AcrR family transcriptional regulator
MSTATESRPPKVGRAQRTREALLRAGRQLFSERPVDSVAIDDIVQAADVAKGSFYNHFTDREALVRAVVAEIRASVEEAIQTANADVEDPARRMARANSVYLRFAVDDPQRARALVRIQMGLINLDARLNQGLVSDIRTGHVSGRFAITTLEAAALFVMGVMQAAVAHTAAEPSRAVAVGLARQMNALILRGLGVPGAEAEAIAAQAADDLVGNG